MGIIRYLILILIGLFIIINPYDFSTATTVETQKPEVEIEIGPEFKGGDETKITDCVLNEFASKFPLDFIAEPPITGGTECPNLEIFNNKYEACYVADIFERINPAIIGGLIIYGIFHL